MSAAASAPPAGPAKAGAGEVKAGKVKAGRPRPVWTTGATPGCADPGRALLHEHVTRHFLDVSKFPQTTRAPCKICGEVVDCVAYDPKTATGTCIAQAAIVAKRSPVLAAGEEATHLAATTKGRNAFNEKDFVIVASAERSRIATNIPPTGPLPTNVEAVRPARLRPYAARRDLILDPPAVPYVAVIWAGQSASVPMKVATFRDVVVINGGLVPVEVDRRRFKAALAAARLLGGPEAFEDALALHDAVAAGSPTATALVDGRPKRVPTQRLLDGFAALRLDDLRATLAALPARGDPETTYLRGILREGTGADAEGPDAEGPES